MLCTWIQRLVDGRVDQACRALSKGDFGNERSQHATLQASRSMVQQAQAVWDESCRCLEAKVQSIVAAQGQLEAVVDGLSESADRRESSGSRVSHTVEQLLCAVDELQHNVKQDSEDVNARLREQAGELEELRRVQSEECARQRAAHMELRRLQGEAAASQQQCSIALAGACATIAATREEVTDFADTVWRVQQELAAWRMETSSEVRDVVGQAQEQSREGLESLRREIEVWQASYHQEVVSQQRQLTAELRAEMQSLLDSEQSGIAALDEQLWRTEQRLGQRLDELAQTSYRRESFAAVADMVARSPAPMVVEGGSETCGSRQAWRAAEQGHHRHGSPLLVASSAAEVLAECAGLERRKAGELPEGPLEDCYHRP